MSGHTSKLDLWLTPGGTVMHLRAQIHWLCLRRCKPHVAIGLEGAAVHITMLSNVILHVGLPFDVVLPPPRGLEGFQVDLLPLPMFIEKPHSEPLSLVDAVCCVCHSNCIQLGAPELEHNDSRP